VEKDAALAGKFSHPVRGKDTLANSISTSTFEEYAIKVYCNLQVHEGPETKSIPLINGQVLAPGCPSIPQSHWQ